MVLPATTAPLLPVPQLPLPIVGVPVVVTIWPLNVCDPVNVFAASVRAIVALVAGNVIVVLSVPDSVRVLVTDSVLPSVRVSVDPVAGAVSVTLLTVVAVATPNVGVVKVGEVVPAGPPVPLEAPPSSVATPVPRPLTPVLIGKPVALVSVPLAGVPSAMLFGIVVDIDGAPPALVTRMALFAVANPAQTPPLS